MTYLPRNLGQLNTTTSPEDTRKDIEEVFRKWGVDEYRMPRDGRGEYGNATIIFYVNDEKHELKCNRFSTYRQNIRALYLILDSLRLAHERGILSELARAAVAFLPAGDRIQKRLWYEVLQVTPTTDSEVVKASYKALARQRHPDSGGTEDAIKELNEAFEEFKRERGE